MIEATFKEVTDAYKGFKDADTSLAGYTLKFPEDINNVDPLTMIKTINAGDNIDVKLNYGIRLVSGKKVEFYFGEEKILGFTYNGEGEFALLFAEKPFLLQTFIDYTYAILLKKLTPPSKELTPRKE